MDSLQCLLPLWRLLAEDTDLLLAPHASLCSSAFSLCKSFLFPSKERAVDAEMREESRLEIHFERTYLRLSCRFNGSVNATKVRMTARKIRGILLTTAWEVWRLEWEAEDGVYVEAAFPWLLRGSWSAVKRCNFSQEPLEIMYNSNIFLLLYYCNSVLSCGGSKHSESSEWKSGEQWKALFSHRVHLHAFSHFLLSSDSMQRK